MLLLKTARFVGTIINAMQDDAPNPPPDEPTVEPVDEPTDETGKSAVTPLPGPQETLPVPAPKPPRNWKRWRKVAGLVVLIIIVAVGAWLWGRHGGPPKKAASTASQAVTMPKKTAAAAAKVQGVQLDPNKDYGNKYANGILPVGDGKYVTSGPKQGYVYACSQYAQNLSGGQGGASTRGPWFTDNNTEYNVNEKLHVEGSVMWQASFSDVLSGGTRTIITNDLPDHPTGIFPIMTTDPAYAYDHNPNTIKGQTLTYVLNADPVYGSPSCMGGESGIMLTGVALFNAFDAGGRDAGAWEVQDACDGHPQTDGIYHYHTLSACIKDTSVRTVIGYALDGFPITGPEVGPNNILTTSDLDECHGLTSQINLDGKLVTMYHYVMTEDFPYSVSCFRGTAIQPPDLALARPSQSGQGQKAPPKP